MAKEEVARWMIIAQQADRRLPNPWHDKPLQWPDRFVADPDQRRTVKLWVWCEARGESFRAVCRQRGLPYTTALRHRQAAIQRITTLLNLEHSLDSDSSLGVRSGAALAT